MNALPAKVSYTDPNQWTEIHRVRNSLPPDNLLDLQQWIHLQHVPGPYDQRIKDGLDFVMENHRGDTESWLAVTGPQRIGKSTTLTRILLDRAITEGTFRHKQPNGRLHTPYVYTEAPSNKPSVKSALGEVAVFMGYADKGTEPVLIRNLTPKFTEQRVQAIVVDEAQHFRRQTAAAATLTDGLRKMLHLPVPVIFCGKYLENSALLRDFGLPGDPVGHLSERVEKVNLEPLTESIVPIAVMLRDLAERFALIDGFRSPGLVNIDAVRALISAKQGSPGRCMEAAKIAATAALKTDRILTADLLTQQVARRTVAA